jgi:hypothetical protein
MVPVSHFDGGSVHGIAFRTHLEDERVEAELCHAVEDGAHFRLLLCGREFRGTGPVDVVHHRCPGAAEFACDGWYGLACGHVVLRLCGGEKQCENGDGTKHELEKFSDLACFAIWRKANWFGMPAGRSS